MTPKLRRRRFIQALGAVGITGLAGCTGQQNTEENNQQDQQNQQQDSDQDQENGSDDEWVETTTIEMNDQLQFVPKRVKISKGDTVTWENVGGIGHTVTAYEDQIPENAEYFASGGYNSEQEARDAYKNEGGGNIPGGESYEHTFNTEGEYEYFCIPHELNGMVGSIKVE